MAMKCSSFLNSCENSIHVGATQANGPAHMNALLVLQLLVGTSPDRAAKSFSVAVDFSAVAREVLGDSALHRAHKSLLVRLVEDGFSLADPNLGGDIVVKVRRTSEQNLNILVETSTGIRSHKLRFGEDAGEQEEFQLIQVTLELVRGARDELSVLVPVAPPPGARNRAVGAQLGGAMLWSGSSTGVMANGDAELKLGPLHLTLGLVAHQPLGLPRALHIFEWGALAGARLGTHALAPWLVLEAALGGGFVQERHSFSDANGDEDRGVLHDPLGSGSLGAAVELTRGLRIGLNAGTWWTLHTRTHTSADETLWKGPKLRPFAGLRVEYLP